LFHFYSDIIYFVSSVHELSQLKAGAEYPVCEKKSKTNYFVDVDYSRKIFCFQS